MAWRPESGPTGRRTTVTTPDEVVRHLREAGAKRVYLARSDAFRSGAIPVVATYEHTAGEPARESGAAAVREMLTSVFDAVGDRVRFHGREWPLDGRVEPAFAEPRTDLLPLYDRGVEHRYGDGFNLRNLLFAYDAYRQSRGHA